MFYTIYVVTNKLDNKWYLGMHQTKDLNDDYFGSGKYLKRAIEKYEIENFEKEILLLCETEKEMKEFEAGILTKEFLEEQQKLGTTYNLLEGGKGGFGYINKNPKILKGFSVMSKEISLSIQRKGGLNSIKFNRSEEGRRIRKEIAYKTGFNKTWIGRKHSEETKEKIRLSNKGKHIGSKNSQFGTFWITNGKENKKCKDIIPEGWYKGMIIKK